MNSEREQDVCRPLTDEERSLAEWMLRNGSPEATDFLEQLNAASATAWKCPCGCASFNFKIAGRPEAPPGVHILGDFLFGADENLAGIFIFESGGILSGVEVYWMGADAPAALPAPGELRPY